MEAFWRLLEAETGRDLVAFFAYWVYGDDLPRLRTTWDPATRILSWAITGDSGTLAGVPFDLQLRQRGRVRYVEVGEGAVTQRWDGMNGARRGPDHGFGFLADRKKTRAAVRFGHGDDRRLVERHALPLQEHQNVGGPEVDRHVLGESAK